MICRWQEVGVEDKNDYHIAPSPTVRRLAVAHPEQRRIAHHKSGKLVIDAAQHQRYAVSRITGQLGKVPIHTLEDLNTQSDFQKSLKFLAVENDCSNILRHECSRISSFTTYAPVERIATAFVAADPLARIDERIEEVARYLRFVRR